MDPAHCRLDLFQYSQTMANDVRTTWDERSGLTFDPWADLASIIGTLDNIRGRRDHNAATRSIEAALNRAVADLTCPESTLAKPSAERACGAVLAATSARCVTA